MKQKSEISNQESAEKLTNRGSGWNFEVLLATGYWILATERGTTA
jgi:hypothetical protein